MLEYSTPWQLQSKCLEWRQNGKIIGLVPTMGNLHAGHLSLLEKLRKRCDILCVSIYVNPLQFGKNEDLSTYPRTLDVDRNQLREQGCDLLFTPQDEALYPQGRDLITKLHIPFLSDILCGKSRPGHFDGVATIVLKLFSLFQPHYAAFGEKDFQQLTIIRKMVQDFHLPIEIISAPTQRAEDGLALSSRNQYLSPDERKTAALLFKQLQSAVSQVKQNPKNWPNIKEKALNELSEQGFIIDYFELRRSDNLSEPSASDPHHSHEPDWLILAATKLGKTRLIDNIRFERPIL